MEYKTSLKKRVRTMILLSTVFVTLTTSIAILLVLHKAVNAMCSFASITEANKIEEKIHSAEFLKVMKVSDLSQINGHCVMSEEMHQGFNEDMKNNLKLGSFFKGYENADKIYAEIKINEVIVYTNIPSGFQDEAKGTRIPESGALRNFNTMILATLNDAKTVLPVMDSAGNRIGSISVVINPEILYVFSRPVVISLMITLLISLMVAYILARVLTKPIVEPLAQLSDKLSVLATNDHVEMQVSMIDMEEPLQEIGELATSTNRIIEKVKNCNREIVAQYEVLEQKNKELDLRNKELSESQDELRSLNATKNKFFSIISHDLKGPFNGMIGLSGMLVSMYDNLSDDEIREYVSDINNSARGVYKLLDNLLLWASSQSGRLEFKPEMINVNELVKTNFEALDIIAKNKNIRLNHTVNETLNAYVDGTMITTVLRNLISNALKFTYEGGGVNISVPVVENGYAQVWVADNGKGIKKEDLGNLFRIDSKVLTVGTAKETGTGLGLILCKEFVEINGGAIWAESEIGKGTIFKFTVPINADGHDLQ